MPCRRSHFASSKPFEAAPAPRSSPSSERRAPCGGDRPSGSSSSTALRARVRPRQRSTVARARSSYDSGARRLLHLDERPLDRADLRREDAVVERGEAHASPGPAHRDEHRRKRCEPEARVRGRTGAAAERDRGDPGRQHRNARGVRRAPNRRTGRRRARAHDGRSRDHEPLQLRQLRGPDSGHALQLGHVVERAVRVR